MWSPLPDRLHQMTSGHANAPPTMMIGGKDAQLAGLIGRVPTGYKLIPIRRIVEVRFDAPPPGPKEKEKEKGVKEEK